MPELLFVLCIYRVRTCLYALVYDYIQTHTLYFKYTFKQITVTSRVEKNQTQVSWICWICSNAAITLKDHLKANFKVEFAGITVKNACTVVQYRFIINI